MFIANFSVNETVMIMGSGSRWLVGDLPRYGQPTHGFETGRARSCASTAEARSGAVSEYRRRAQRAFRLQNGGHLQEHFLELAAKPWIDAKARPLALEVQQPRSGALCAGGGAGCARLSFARALAWWRDRGGGR